MSDFGSDEKVSVSACQDLAYEKHFTPFDDVYVLQWSYAAGRIVRQLGSRRRNTSVSFLVQQ